jgi:hypothetical protein
MSTLQIISAAERIQETKGITGCIFGKSGIGKTSLLHTLPAEGTLFFDLEAGALAVESWQGDTIRPRTWQECRDLAALISGPNPALRDDQFYSNAHYAAVCKRLDKAVIDKYETIFVDSITVASRLCFQWCKGQPQAFSEKSGKYDTRGAYGLQGHEMLGWLTHLQHTRNKNIWFIGILDEKLDEFGRRIYSLQLEGSKTALELPGIVDEVITMAEIKSSTGKPVRAFICQTINEYGYPAKDRSGRLSQVEPPHLGKLMAKIKGTVTKPKEEQHVAEQQTEAHKFTTAGDADLVTNSTTTINNEVTI